MTMLLLFISQFVLISSSLSCPYDSTGGTCNGVKYLVDSLVCVDACPTLYTPYQWNCPACKNYCSKPTGTSAILFTLELASVQDLTLTYVSDPTDSSNKFSNTGGVPYKSLTEFSPLPTLDRGFYFTYTSAMVSSQSYIPGIYFILNLVIKVLDYGEILNVQIGSDSYLRIWADPSGVYYFSVLIYDSSGVQASASAACAVNYSSSWHTVSMYLVQWTCSTASLVFYYNGNTQGSTYLTANEIRFPNGVYKWYFGNATPGNSFRGFIYWLQARADTSAIYSQTTTIDCDDIFYWDGSACQACGLGCPIWPWCVRGSDCSYCYVKDCSACNGYSYNMCTACYTGIPPMCCDHLGTTCSQTWTNTACNTGFYLIGGICMYGYPFGFVNNVAPTSAILNADFTGTFSGIYQSVLITGTSSSSYNYWNSPESSDPFPAKNRGLYFNTNQLLAGQINLSHTWSMGIWVYAISGNIIGYSGDYLVVKSDGTISFYLERWDGMTASYSASISIALNAWKYLSFSVEFSNKVTKLTPYTNNSPGTPISVPNYVFRLAYGGFLSLGQNFNGFISYFQLWGIIITNFSAQYSLGISLRQCDYSHYYDGASCQPCLNSCTIGCTRGTSCYICDDFLCSECSSFNAGTCTLCIPNASGTPCACNSGFYQPTNQALCSACYTGCSTCTGPAYYSCTSCSANYFFYNNNLCLTRCPSGYTENNSAWTCDFLSNTGLSLNLYDKIYLNSISQVKVGSIFTNKYPFYDNNDPYPAYLRGYYFTGTTYMTKLLQIGPYFTISMWINPNSAGIILVKNAAGTDMLCLEILSGSGFPKISLLLRDSSTLSVTLTEKALNGGWNFIAFTGEIDTSYKTTVNSYFNSLTKETGTSSNVIYFQDGSASNLFIGTKATYDSGFIGFLYDLYIFNTNNLQYVDFVTLNCISPCTSCPSDLNCLDTCPIIQYYDGTGCANCNSCPKGCRYDDTCGLCKTKQCYECTLFSGSCTSCITNAEDDGLGGCQCKANAFWHSSASSCDFCDALCATCKQTTYFECNTCIGGKQMVGIICLNDCPYGYGASCASVSSAVIDQSFDTDFQGSYGIFTTGTDSSKYQHFVSPETIDPIPAYARGLYFDGSMYLLSSVSVYLSHSFSMGAWIYVITDGDLLQKQSTLILASTGIITATMEDTTQTTSTETLSPTSPSSGWAYISFTIYYTSNASVISAYINGVSIGSTTISGKIYRDIASTNLSLGKSNSSGFIGFIYYFQLWNVQVTGFLSIISSFSFCGTGQMASCLSSCDISTYKNGATCSLCNSCNKGCIRASTCNICDDILCSVCSGFGPGKCITCVANASKQPVNCACDLGYTVSSDGFSCVMCLGTSAGCTALSCSSSTYFYQETGQCLNECPTGYIANSATHICDHLSDLALSLDLTDQIRLDTVSSFNVGSLHNNLYPDFDIYDPIPAYKRGYYFNQKSYLSSTVMIAPSFTISMWQKALGAPKILLTKYTTSDILQISLDSTCRATLSIIFYDFSSYSFHMGPNICNHWNFLSFTGEVQNDGKTKLTLYWDTNVNNQYITPNLNFFSDTLSGTLYVGNDETLGNSGFKGFLARLMIYNTFSHFADDKATSTCQGCAYCPANNQCLSVCNLNTYPDSCSACLSVCNNGCVSNLACTLCRDKECYSCTTFSGECTSCITNAYKLAGHCKCLDNAIWVLSSQSCELCYATCLTCSSTKYTDCVTCVSGKYMIQSLCNTFCPIGYVINGSNCDSDPAYTDAFVFNLKPHQIKDITIDLASNIPVLTGKDNKFYPNYDNTDPIATIYRGYYFTGSSYMQLPPYSGTVTPLLTFAPKFVISAWIKPISDSGAILCKQFNSGGFEQYVNFQLINKFPSLKLILQDFTPVLHTANLASLEVSISQWNFISAVSDISATPKQIIQLVKNSVSELSGDLYPSWLNDLKASFYITIGACHLDSTNFSSFFTGFLWDLKIYNTLISTALASSTCNGCSLCPIDNSNNCLDSCLIDSYWTGSTCEQCSVVCAINGCARVDKNCNLCQDIICEICDDYTSTCITCRAHASLSGLNCQCDLGYYWDNNSESCELCYISCGTCINSSSTGCLTCANGYYMGIGICKAGCPSGYYLASNGCVAAKEKVFDLDLNTLKGVIYDKASSIPVITGSTSQFYPNYELDDPIPAYLRGFWFNGSSSLLRLPEYSNYISPRLILLSTFTISIWLNSESSNSALLSKHIISDNYSVLYSILLLGNKPSIFLIIDSSQVLYIAQKSINNYEWSNVVFVLEDALTGYSEISCYINGVLDSSRTVGYGAFKDIGPQTTMTIGAQISSSAIYNYYQGFIYTIQMFNIIKPISALSTVSCAENCSACPISQICIPNCKINEYWSGPGYNICSHCNIKCSKTCRNWRDTCSLCDNLLCDICDDYSDSGCLSCKENAINADSCICDGIYVPDPSTNSTCIEIPDGGYKGSDGYFYLCPNLCTICQSSTKCTACVNNASIINDICYCNIGYSGITNCSLVSFYAKLTAMSDNSLYLTFSDALANNLTVSDFTILIQNQGKISFKIESINSTCYYISLKITKQISKGTLTILQFLDLNDVRSISNGILNTSELSVALNSYDPEPNNLEAVTSQSTAGVQLAVTIAASLSFFNPSPSSLWSLMNTLEYLSYLTISGIPLSTNIRAFLNALNNFNLFPNIFIFFIEENEGNTPYSEAQDFGYDSDLILITTGNDFTMILASISVLPIILYFSKCSHRWISKKFIKMAKDYYFSFYLRWWIQCYLELGAAACIGLLTFGFKTVTQLSNAIICVIVLICLAITPPAYFLLSYKNKNRIQTRENNFAGLFGSFFYEFRTDRGFLTTQYYLVFFTRRLIYIISLVYLRDYPESEVTINIVLSLMTIMYLWFFWPFEDQILQICNLVTEILICLVMGATSIYLFNLEQSIVSATEYMIAATVITAIGIQLVSSILIFARNLYEMICEKLKKAGVGKKDDGPLRYQIKS